MKELSSLIITSLDWLKKDTFLEVQKPTMQEGTKSVHGIATSDAISPVQIDSHGKSGGNQIPTKSRTVLTVADTQSQQIEYLGNQIF